MSSTIRLASGLPEGDKNGLPSIADALVEDPKGLHVAIVLLDAGRLITSVDDDSTLPVARIRAIEPIAQGPDADELRRLLRRAVEKRTGQTELPLDLERALDELGVHAEEDDLASYNPDGDGPPNVVVDRAEQESPAPPPTYPPAPGQPWSPFTHPDEVQ